MRVLGIDPGTEVMGYGAVARDGSRIRHLECGVIRVRGEISTRLHELHVNLLELLELLAPDAVAMEDAFYQRNVRTAIRLGQAQAVLMVAAGAAGVPVTLYAPARVKKAVVGNGNAAKQQVQDMVCRILGLDDPPTPLDASDALGVAICHLHNARSARALSQA